jgi:hypothetical protein
VLASTSLASICSPTDSLHLMLLMKDLRRVCGEVQITLDP